MPHPFFDVATPIAIGHRGCAGETPENTLEAFERGLADGAQILETDVHLTRDRVPVLIHDDEVDRCTDGTGPVRELDLASLKALDAGHRFTPDGGRSHPFRQRGITIPTLVEALAAFPSARFNLELKEPVPHLVERTVEEVGRAGREEDVLMTAADDAVMTRLRRCVATEGLRVALGACVGEVAQFARAAASGAPPPEGPMALQIPTEFAGQPLVTPALLTHAHRFDVQIHVWTVNDPDEMARLVALGVDGIVTDYPARAAALRQG